MIENSGTISVQKTFFETVAQSLQIFMGWLLAEVPSHFFRRRGGATPVKFPLERVCVI